MDPQKPVVLAVVAVAFGAWIVAVISYFRMLANARRPCTDFVFNGKWWYSSDLSEDLTPVGLIHHKRFMRTLLGFFGAVFAGVLVSIMTAFLRG